MIPFKNNVTGQRYIMSLHLSLSPSLPSSLPSPFPGHYSFSLSSSSITYFSPFFTILYLLYHHPNITLNQTLHYTVAVFGVYGIDVNARHLSLIADFMTRTGSYLPMSRLGMNDCASPFLQMSFETTSLFLTKAASEGEREKKSRERRGDNDCNDNE